MDYDEDPPAFCRSCHDWRRAHTKQREQIAELEKRIIEAGALLQAAIYLMGRWGYNPTWISNATAWMDKATKGETDG